MFRIRVIASGSVRDIYPETGSSLLAILRSNGFNVYAPCGGRGACGKCSVRIRGLGEILSCRYFPDKDIEVLLPGREESNILIHQTEYLLDLPFVTDREAGYDSNAFGAAIDIGTTTIVIYFINLYSGEIEKISSFLNPQIAYGADIITRITYCQQTHEGLEKLQKVITGSLNEAIQRFKIERRLHPGYIKKLIVAGNNTMLHILLGVDPVPLALAPFRPAFIETQVRKGTLSELIAEEDTLLITLPSVSAYVGADIVAGLAVLKTDFRRYLFLDIGTNGEMALVNGKRILTCATAAGPAFEGANLSCGMAALTGAISHFHSDGSYDVIGNGEPAGICGSGIIDIVAYMLHNGIIDSTGLLNGGFSIGKEGGIEVSQQDIREIQLAKAAIFSGMRILLQRAGLRFGDLDALFLAGGFGNYINISSAIEIRLLPVEMKDKIFPVGNSAVIGALQYIRNSDFSHRIRQIQSRCEYVELSDDEGFATEFAMNMDFPL